MKNLLIIFTIVFTSQILATEKALFSIEKSHNPQNIMIVSSNLGDQCEFSQEEPVDYYWLMNRTSRKDPHPMILKEINNPEISVITIEDPIEYSLPGVDQIQVNAKTGLTFATRAIS